MKSKGLVAPGRIRSGRRLQSIRRLWRGTGGQSLAEFAFVLPLLLVVLLGLIEFGNALSVKHAMAGLSREGANIAARGASLDTVLVLVTGTGSDINLAARGGSVVSRIDVQGGVPLIVQQVATSGYGNQSRFGTVGDSAASIPVGYADGSDHYAVEIFYGYQPITPLPNMLLSAIPNQIYERSVF
jgi:hypothetical protein